MLNKVLSFFLTIKLTYSIVGKNVEFDSTNIYRNVGVLATYDINNVLQTICSCSLINSNWVITAGHCVIDDFNILKSMVVWFDQPKILLDDIINHIGGIEANEWFAHPNWEKITVNNGKDEFAKKDIGLIYFSQPIDNNFNPKLPILNIDIVTDEQLQNNYDITFIGFGFHTNENTFGSNKNDPLQIQDEDGYVKRRYATFTIKSHTNSPKSVDFETLMFRYTSNGNAGSCFGDSGASIINSNGNIVGVHVQLQGSYNNCAGNGFAVNLNDPNIAQFIYDNVY